VSDLVRQVRLRWFGYVERKAADDWVSARRNMAVSGERGDIEVGTHGRSAWQMTLGSHVILGNRPTVLARKYGSLTDYDNDNDVNQQATKSEQQMNSESMATFHF
jgi:hypothetical protein